MKKKQVVIRLPRFNFEFEEVAIVNKKNVLSLEFIKFIYFRVTGHTNCQIGYCKKHPKSLLFNGECERCWE